MKKIIALVLSFILIFLFTSCNSSPQEPFPDLYEVLEKGIGLTKNEFKSQLGDLGEKETSYLQHHYGDIYFPNLMTSYPDDATSYKGEEESVKILRYQFSPRALFVAKDENDKTEGLMSVSYSIDNTLEELYHIVKAFHNDFLEKYPNASYDKSFDDILYSKQTFIDAFNQNKEVRHTYTKRSVGCEQYHFKKLLNYEVEDTAYRNVWVMNYYEDSSFFGKVSLSIHSDFGKENYWHRFNIVYQDKVLRLNYNTNTNELFYKYGDTSEIGVSHYGSTLFALDF